MYLDALQIGHPFDLKVVLHDMTTVLNETASRSIGGVSPMELVKNNQVAVSKMRRATKPYLYWNDTDRAAFFRLVNRHIIAEPGQFVRVTSARTTFEKMSQRKHSKRELFQVHRVRFPIPENGTVYSMYQLKDSNQNIISGFFRTSEIIPLSIKLSPKKPSFRFHILKWKKAKQPGMIWVQYAGMSKYIQKAANQFLPS